MSEDLNLIGARYSIIVLVFFPTYFLFNFVGTVCVRKLGPRPFLSGITLSFGLISIGIGLVDNWVAVAGLRVLLGAFESCFCKSRGDHHARRHVDTLADLYPSSA